MEYKHPSYNENFSYTNEHELHLWHGENTIKLSDLNGTDGNFITIRANDYNTLLKGDGANVFRVQNCSYLKIESSKIEERVESIPLSTANALQFVYIHENTVVDSNDPT